MTRYLTKEEVELMEKGSEEFMKRIQNGEKIDIKLPEFKPLSNEAVLDIIQKQLDGKQ